MILIDHQPGSLNSVNSRSRGAGPAIAGAGICLGHMSGEGAHHGDHATVEFCLTRAASRVAFARGSDHDRAFHILHGHSSHRSIVEMPYIGLNGHR